MPSLIHLGPRQARRKPSFSYWAAWISSCRTKCAAQPRGPIRIALPPNISAVERRLPKVRKHCSEEQNSASGSACGASSFRITSARAERTSCCASARRRASSTHTRSSQTRPNSPGASARSGPGIARVATGMSATAIKPARSSHLAFERLFRMGGADRGHVEDANALRPSLDARDERIHHLADRHETEAQRRLAQRRQPLGKRVERDEEIRPAVPGTEHVPRAQDGRREPACLNARLTLLPHG